METSEENTGVGKSERKYQVFISSTFRDLADQRRMVLDGVIDRGHMPILLERFPAADSAVPFVIEKTIEASQIYIVILGFRYGAIVKGRDISFSQLEYERALKLGRIVVPFLLAKAEVDEGRAALAKELAEARTHASILKEGTHEYTKSAQEIADLEAELANESKLWNFRSIVQEGRFCQPFSLKKGGDGSGERVEQFDKHMVLKALLVAEEEAVRRGVPGWIREPKERKLAETLEAVWRNRFLVDVVGAMAKFDLLVPRIRDQAEEKQAAASFFADKYLQQLLAKKVSLFFESGSSVSYVAQVVGERLRERHNEIRISTNNVLAYLIFWLVHRVRCSLFPWGPPEQRYGAVFGPINDLVPEWKQPFFPPEPLSSDDEEAIGLLRDDPYGPAKWDSPRKLLLGALSGLQLTPDSKISNCLGPHVGSPRNKVFKRYMYATELPVMLFMTANKIDSPVNLERCHFILEQSKDQDLPWEVFYRDRPVAFCVGCKNMPAEIAAAVTRFEALGFKPILAGHKTPYTAFIVRNQKFIDDLESGMKIR